MKFLPILCLVPCFAVAAPSVPVRDVMSASGLDPTVLRSRVKVTNEYSARDFGVSENTTKLNLTYAFGNVARRDWNVQLDLPVVHNNAGDQATPTDATGLGDIELRGGHVFDGAGVFRWGLGAEAHFNTASEPQLGDGVFRLSSGLQFALQPSRSFKFQTTIQFDQSLSTDAGVPEQQRIKVKPAVQFDLPADCYGYVETELVWDLQACGRFGSKLKVELGHAFGSREQWVASIRYETPLTESSEQYTATAGLAYVFR